MIAVIAERGYEGASVEAVCARAGVSRRTFYELFGSFEECFLEILDHGMETMAAVMLGAFAGHEDWLDALLAGEAAVLDYLDGEPEFARVLLVDALGTGSWALARRQDNVGALRDMIVERFEDTPLGGDFPPMAAAGVMASLLGIMHEHLLRREPEPLISLLGPLMGVITAPYLDEQGVEREVRRGEELAREIQARKVQGVERGGLEVPAWLRNVRSERARMCVLYLAEHPGSSNRELAAGIGITNEGQVSKLLTRLEHAGILDKLSHGPGKPNACRLTPYGEEIARHFEPHEYP
jgi:AcrR family transcriptional regulator